MILDGGPCEAGLESTIVAVRDNGWQILRPGPVTAEAIAKVACSQPIPHVTSKIEAPGQLESHYSPSKPLRLDAHAAHRHEFLIGFGAIPGDYNLSADANLAQAAAHLFDALHIADAAECSAIAVAEIPRSGIGEAINDRLARASAH